MTADAVISVNPMAVLEGVLINSATSTATIQFYDDKTTTTPARAVTDAWTLGTVGTPVFIGPMQIPCPTTGLTVKITGTVDATVIFK